MTEAQTPMNLARARSLLEEIRTEAARLKMHVYTMGPFRYQSEHRRYYQFCVENRWYWCEEEALAFLERVRQGQYVSIEQRYEQAQAEKADREQAVLPGTPK